MGRRYDVSGSYEASTALELNGALAPELEAEIGQPRVGPEFSFLAPDNPCEDVRVGDSAATFWSQSFPVGMKVKPRHKEYCCQDVGRKVTGSNPGAGKVCSRKISINP